LRHCARATATKAHPLSEGELDAALKCLLDKGLVTGTDGAEAVLINIELTGRGIDCAEHFGGSVSDYLRQTETGNTTVNFHAPVTGSTVAWANRDVTQTRTRNHRRRRRRARGTRAPSNRPGRYSASTTWRTRSCGELDGPDPAPAVVTSVMRRVLGKIGEVGYKIECPRGESNHNPTAVRAGR
jgi:hypothetical protein